MDKRVSYATILLAKQGNPEAMRAILRHYSAYIKRCSTRIGYDQFGNSCRFLDEDIRQDIEAVLMQQIIYRFDPYRLPAGETIED